MKIRSRLGLIIMTMLFCFSAVIFTGCGGRKEGELVIWWPTGSEAMTQALNNAKDDYVAANPGVSITVKPQTTPDFVNDYIMAIGTNAVPDIAYMDHVYVQQLAYEDYIADLGEYGVEDVKSKYIDSLWTPNLYNNKCYALPVSANVLATVYNKTILNDVLGEGFAVPSTYEQLKTACQAVLDYNVANNLTGDNAITPYTIPAGTGNKSMSAMSFLSYVAREDGKIISDDLRTMSINSDECKSAANKLLELAEHKYIDPTFQEGKFASGNVAFIEMGCWKIEEYKLIQQQKNIEFGYAPIVTLKDGGNRASGLGLYSAVVTKGSPNEALAADFVKYLTTNDEFLLGYNKSASNIPTTKTAITDSFYSGDVWSVYLEQLNDIVMRPGSPEWASIEKEVFDFVSLVLKKEDDADGLNSLNYILQVALDDIYGN